MALYAGDGTGVKGFDREKRATASGKRTEKMTIEEEGWRRRTPPLQRRDCLAWRMVGKHLGQAGKAAMLQRLH